ELRYPSAAMPVYEYRCVDCDERFEVEQSMADATLETINGDDHTHQVKKVFSPVGISFKGSGFYKNDSASSKKKQSPKSSTADPASSGSDTASKAESGSDTKSETSTTSKKNSSDATPAST
ncbi:MAG: FmdB family zinc ribbon protein, partial [Acidimicrobiales bacterium]